MIYVNKKMLQQKLLRRDKRISSMCVMLNLLNYNHLTGGYAFKLSKSYHISQ